MTVLQLWHEVGVAKRSPFQLRFVLRDSTDRFLGNFCFGALLPIRLPFQTRLRRHSVDQAPRRRVSCGVRRRARAQGYLHSLANHPAPRRIQINVRARAVTRRRGSKGHESKAVLPQMSAAAVAPLEAHRIPFVAYHPFVFRSKFFLRTPTRQTYRLMSHAQWVIGTTPRGPHIQFRQCVT